MDGSRFDELARALARPPSRRAIVKTLAGGALGALLARRALAALAAFDPDSIIFER